MTSLACRRDDAAAVEHDDAVGEQRAR